MHLVIGTVAGVVSIFTSVMFQEPIQQGLVNVGVHITELQLWQISFVGGFVGSLIWDVFKTLTSRK